jgi:uncharacterized membrane protein
LDPLQRDLEALRALVLELSGRVERLERAFAQAVTSDGEQELPTRPASNAPAVVMQTRAAAPAPEPPSTERPADMPTGVDKLGLESRIGSQWLSRIGIAAVLVGVSYFLKYAFENNWIGAGGRLRSEASTSRRLLPILRYGWCTVRL